MLLNSIVPSSWLQQYANNHWQFFKVADLGTALGKMTTSNIENQTVID